MARILFLVPHPDDEIVAAAATIAARVAAGDSIFALYLTDGIPAAEQLWRWDRTGREERVRQRHAEARAAAAALGLEPMGFSGWPSRTLKAHLAEAADWIERTVGRHDIDTLWASAFEGGHQDHDAANFLAAQWRDRLPVQEFAEYNAGGGRRNWNAFARLNNSETVRRLTSSEVAAKRALLALYRSETANLAGVRLDRESHRPLPAYDYGKPPHRGRLWREAHQWVGRLVLHPRVDFEPSRAVYQALSTPPLRAADNQLPASIFSSSRALPSLSMARRSSGRWRSISR